MEPLNHVGEFVHAVVLSGTVHRIEYLMAEELTPLSVLQSMRLALKEIEAQADEIVIPAMDGDDAVEEMIGKIYADGFKAGVVFFSGELAKTLENTIKRITDDE